MKSVEGWLHASIWKNRSFGVMCGVAGLSPFASRAVVVGADVVGGAVRVVGVAVDAGAGGALVVPPVLRDPDAQAARPPIPAAASKARRESGGITD